MPGSPQWYRWIGTTLELRIRVQTQCREEGIVGPAGDLVRVRVNAPPVEGKANERLTTVLAQAFGVPRSRVRLVHGARSRRKLLRIENPRHLPKGLKSALNSTRQVDQT